MRPANWASLGGALLALLMPVTVLAASGSAADRWRFTIDHRTLDAHDPTQLTIEVANTGSPSAADIRCAEITVPPSFDVEDAEIDEVPDGQSWSVAILAGPGSAHRLRLVAQDGGLDGGGNDATATFTVTATGVDVGTWQWSGDAWSGASCSGGSFATFEVSVTVRAEATPPPPPTPRPTTPPTPTPSPTDTPSPTNTPTPTTSPTPTPTATPTSTPTGSPGATASADVAGPTPGSAGSTGGGRPGTGGAAPGPTGAGGQVPATPGAASTPMPALDPAELVRLPVGHGSAAGELPAVSIDMPLGGDLAIQWAVPTLVVGVPGLLLTGAVVAQAAGGLIWLPVAWRRLGRWARSTPGRGSDRGQRRRDEA